MRAADVERPHAGRRARTRCRWPCATASSSSVKAIAATHRAEDLLAHGGRVGVDVGEHRGLDEVAAELAVGAAAADRGGALAPARPRGCPVTFSNCCRVGQRAHLGRRARAGCRARSSRARAAIRSTSSSWTSSCTISREPAMHVWPVAANTPAMTPLAAASRSASANTTCADLPPSSSVTRARWLVAPSATSMPVLVEPVNATLSTPGWRTSARPTSGPLPVIDVEHAGGDARLGHELGELERGHRRVVARLDRPSCSRPPARARASRSAAAAASSTARSRPPRRPARGCV